MFYLDDGTLAGSVQDVLHDLQTVERKAGDLGLHLNHSKSEIICVDDSTSRAMLQAYPDLCVVSPEQATLLGSAIGGQAGVDSSIRTKIKALEVMGSRLRHLQAHDAYCLLRHAFAILKVLYTLRSSPCSRSPELQSFDLLLRSLLSGIVNIDISEDNCAWTQASLPVWLGGLGIRSTTLLAPSAFLALAAGCSGIVHLITPHRLVDAPYHACEDALGIWKEGHNQPPLQPRQPPIKGLGCSTGYSCVRGPLGGSHRPPYPSTTPCSPRTGVRGMTSRPPNVFPGPPNGQ